MAGERADLSTPWLLRQLGIERSEWWLVLCGASCLFAVGWADVSLANIAEVYFLKRVGVEYLPEVFLGSAALLFITGIGLARFVANRDRSILLPGVFAVLAVVLLGLWALFHFLIPDGSEWLLLISKQFKTAIMLVFWVALGDLLVGRQAKRLSAPLLAGLTLGSIAGSFASGAIGSNLGIEAVLPITALVLFLGAIASLPLSRLLSGRLERGLSSPREIKATQEPEGETSLLTMWQSNKLFRLLVLLVVLGSLVAPMLYYQFQVVVDAATSGADGEERLLDLYSQIRGWLNVAVLIVQLKLASVIYRRIGVPLSSSVTPLLFIAGFIGLTFSMSLGVGVAAMVTTRLSNQALHQPAIKVLFNLLPESLRARATAFLDGPLDRLGGAMGNACVLLALKFGSVSAVSMVAIPIAIAWGVVAAIIWRAYPQLLLGAAGGKGLGGDDERDPSELLDRQTLRSFSKDLLHPDEGHGQGALELICEAKPEVAAGVLFETIEKAPADRMPLIAKGLVDLLETTRGQPVSDLRLAQSMADWAVDHDEPESSLRADLLWAATHLCGGRKLSPPVEAALERAQADTGPTVRLVASAALKRAGRSAIPASEIDRQIETALQHERAAERSSARRELSDLLLEEEVDEEWFRRLRILERLLEDPELRLEAASSLAEVALKHGKATQEVGDSMQALRHDREPRIRAAALRYTGFAGFVDRADWLVEALASKTDVVARAAEEGLLALGPQVAQALLVGHSFGRRSGRTMILSVLRQLGIEQAEIFSLYEAELQRLRDSVVRLFVVTASEHDTKAIPTGEAAVTPIVKERLGERIDEGVRSILLFLSVLKGDNQISELEPALRRSTSQRERSIVLEALESLLSPAERDNLLPLLDDVTLEGRVRSLANVSGFRIPELRDTVLSLLSDPDELTRTLATATWPEGFDEDGDRARRAYAEEYPDMLSPVEIMLLLKTVPLFERLMTRHLMDLAQTMQEERFDAGSVICREGEVGNCMYLVVEGTVKVTAGSTLLAETGEGDFFGEMALFDGITRSATVTAGSDVLLLRLDRNDLMNLMEELPAIAIGLCQVLSHRLRESNRESTNGAEADTLDG